MKIPFLAEMRAGAWVRDSFPGIPMESIRRKYADGIRERPWRPTNWNPAGGCLHRPICREKSERITCKRRTPSG